MTLLASLVVLMNAAYVLHAYWIGTHQTETYRRFKRDLQDVEPEVLSSN